MLSIRLGPIECRGAGFRRLRGGAPDLQTSSIVAPRATRQPPTKTRRETNASSRMKYTLGDFGPAGCSAFMPW